jgi:hypothetical protein
VETFSKYLRTTKEKEKFLIVKKKIGGRALIGDNFSGLWMGFSLIKQFHSMMILDNLNVNTHAPGRGCRRGTREKESKNKFLSCVQSVWFGKN